MSSVQGRSTAVALAVALAVGLALGGCSSGSGDAGAPSPAVSPTTAQSSSTLRATHGPVVLDGPLGGGPFTYVFYLNGFEFDPVEVREGRWLWPWQGSVTHMASWNDVVTFTVDPSSTAGGCRLVGARVIGGQRELIPERRLPRGGASSIDVNNEPYEIQLSNCPWAVVTAS